MTWTQFVRTGAVIAASGASVVAQPTSTSPLDPPSNGMRRVESTWSALVNATVHPAPGKVIEHATVVLHDGRIASIDTNPAPKGARVWDCTGLHVYAGFMDPYVEVDAPRPGHDDPGRHWNGAITPERRALDGSGLAEQGCKELRELGFTSAAISPKGGIFRGTAAVVSLAKRDDDVSSPKPEVYAGDVYQAAALDSGGAGESLAWQGYPGSEMGAIALMRQTFIDADWQAAARGSGAMSGPANSLDALWKSRARGSTLAAAGGEGAKAAADAASMPVLFDCADELDVLRSLKIAKEFGRSAMILGSGNEFRRLAAIGGSDVPPMIVPVNFPEAPKMASISEADGIELREMMTWEQAPTNPRRMHDLGGLVAFTTGKLRGKGKFWENVRLSIRHGLSPDDALDMVTRGPAQIAGVAGEVGTVEKGRRANLTITEGDWFDPHATSADGGKPRMREVWIDGVRHEIAPAKGAKLEGVWDVAITPAPPGAAEGKFRVTFTFDDDNSLTITKYAVGADGKPTTDTIKPREQKFEKGRLSFTFEHEPFGEPGVFITQGVVEGDAIHGDFIRASGVRMTFVATRRPHEAVLGEWRVIEYDGKAKAVEDRDQVRVTIGKDSIRLVFTDEAGKRTVIKADDVHVGRDEKKDFEATSSGQQIADPDGPVVTFTHGLEKLGGKGKSTDSLRRDPANPDVLVGEGVLPKEEGQAEAPKHSYKLGRMTEAQLAAERDSRRPRGVVGTWRMTLVDDDARLVGPKPEEPRFIEIDEQGNVTLRGPGPDGAATAVKATTKVFADSRIEYDVDTGLLDPAREAATVKVQGTRHNDLLIGSMVVPDGSTHTWKAARVAVWGDEPGDDDSEIIEIAKVPEGLAYPFGPYGLAELPKQQNVVVKNATIWTSGPLGTIEHGTLVIVNGKVEMVGGPDLAVKMPEGTLVIDAQGKHVTPGLIDCHSHTGISRGVNEGGQAVTSEVRIGDVTNPDAISWYRQLAGGITTVNSLHGSANPIGGQNQVNKNRWGAILPDDMHFEGAIPGIKFALGENVKQGNGPRVTSRYPRSRMGVETLIRDRFTAAKEYIAHGGDKNFHRDLELEALAEIIQGKRLVHCHSYRQDEILMLCRISEEFGFKIGTFQHILEGYKVADELRKHAGGASGFSDWWAYKIEVQDAIPEGGPIMHEQGVTVSYNSDSDEMARRMNVEAGKAVKYSVDASGKPAISPADALKFVTLNPAKQLQIDSKVGSLEKGKDGDFVIWSGNPLSSMSKAEQTWIDGKCYFSLEKDHASRERITAERARLTQRILGGLASKKDKKDGKGEAKGEEGKKEGDGAPPEGGRRRRRPQDDAGSGREELVSPDAPPADWWMRRYYMDLYMRGLPIDSARQGECGCYGN